MKKAEIILAIIALIGITMNLTFIPGGTILLILSIAILSMLYMYLGFALLNGVRLRNAFKSESFKGIGTKRMVSTVLFGVAFSTTVVGILFKLLFWPGSRVCLMAGLFTLIISLLVAFITKAQQGHSSRIMLRAAIYGAIGLILLLIPTETWISINYRDYPPYVEAVKKSLTDPANEELRQKMEDEREKMYEFRTGMRRPDKQQ